MPTTGASYPDPKRHAHQSRDEEHILTFRSRNLLISALIVFALDSPSNAALLPKAVTERSVDGDGCRDSTAPALERHWAHSTIPPTLSPTLHLHRCENKLRQEIQSQN